MEKNEKYLIKNKLINKIIHRLARGIKTKREMKKANVILAGTLLCGILVGGCKKEEKNPPAEYFHHEGHSYQIVKQNKTWAAAAADAVARGGYLVEIDNQAEQDAVYAAILQSGISPSYVEVADGGGIGYIWIGAMTLGGPGMRPWTWNGANKTSGFLPVFWMGNEDGFDLGGLYNNWGGTSKGSLNEPDNFTHPTYAPNGQNAAAIGLASWPKGSSSPLGIAGEWNDIAETNTIYYIVEYNEIKE